MSVEPSGESDEQRPSSPARPWVGVVVKGILAAAAVLPIVALATCSTAMKPYAEDATAWRAIELLGLGGLAGFIALLIFLKGTERRFSGPAVIVNVAGMIANVAYFLTHFHYTPFRSRTLLLTKGR